MLWFVYKCGTVVNYNSMQCESHNNNSKWHAHHKHCHIISKSCIATGLGVDCFWPLRCAAMPKWRHNAARHGSNRDRTLVTVSRWTDTAVRYQPSPAPRHVHSMCVQTASWRNSRLLLRQIRCDDMWRQVRQLGDDHTWVQWWPDSKTGNER